MKNSSAYFSFTAKMAGYALLGLIVSFVGCSTAVPLYSVSRLVVDINADVDTQSGEITNEVVESDLTAEVPGDVSEDPTGTTVNEKVVDNDLVKHCSKMTGVDTRKLHFTDGSMTNISLRSGEGIVVKLSGNQSSAELEIRAVAEGVALGAVCIYQRGNETQVKVKCKGEKVVVNHTYCNNRSNHARTHFEVEEGAKIERFFADLGGNRPELEISGSGSYPYPTVSARGHNPTVTCRR